MFRQKSTSCKLLWSHTRCLRPTLICGLILALLKDCSPPPLLIPLKIVGMLAINNGLDPELHQAHVTYQKANLSQVQVTAATGLALTYAGPQLLEHIVL